MHSCPVQTTIQPINNTIPEWALFLQAVIQMRQSVQLVPTVPVMALKALCTVEFSMDQLQNLVGHVHAWSKYSAWCILSVSVMQMIFAVKEDCVNKTLFSVSFKINKLLYFEHMQPYSGAKQVFFASFSLTQLSFSHPAPRCLNGKYICSMGMLV